MNLVEGQKNGAIKIFYEDGKLNEIRSYKNNAMHGTWVTYNQQGVKIAEANYANGQKHGAWFVWDDKGILRTEMSYTQGEKAGTWKRFDEIGKLIDEKKF